MSYAHVETIKHSCLTVATRNLTMWKPVGEEGGNIIMIPPGDIIEPASCPNECFDRGHCTAGMYNINFFNSRSDIMQSTEFTGGLGGLGTNVQCYLRIFSVITIRMSE